LEFNHNAHAVAIACVAHVGDVFDFLVVDQSGDVLDEDRLVHLIRNFGDDNGLTIFGKVFAARLGATAEASPPRAVGFEASGASVNYAGRGEVRALAKLQNFREL